MKLKDRLSDTTLSGIVLGIILIPIFYFFAELLRSGIVSIKNDEYILRPPTSQLIALLFSMLVFRVLMINWKKENTGKGFLIVIMLGVISYFYLYLKIKQQQ